MSIVLLKTRLKSQSSFNKWVRLLIILVSLIIANLNFYLFNSSIYLTVLIDANCVRNYIFYKHSNGVSEIMSSNNNWGESYMSSLEDILNVLDSQNFNKFLKSLDFSLKERTTSFFYDTIMINKYKKSTNTKNKYE